MENESMEIKFNPGDIVVHPLGFPCMVSQVFDSMVKDEVNEQGETVKVKTKLNEPVYELEYFSEVIGLQKTKLIQSLLKLKPAKVVKTKE